MSVVDRTSAPSSVFSSNTFESMGMVFRRSTTLWTWFSDLNNAARLMLSFMADDPCSNVRESNYSTAFAGTKRFLGPENGLYKGFLRRNRAGF